MYPPNPLRLLIQKLLFIHLLEGRKPIFVNHLLERTCSLSSIFHPDHLIRERHPVFKERRHSLQSDPLECSFYVVVGVLSNLDKSPKSHLLSGEALQEGNTHQHIPPILHYISNSLKRSLIQINLYIFLTQLGETPIQENTHQQISKVLISTQVLH